MKIDSGDFHVTMRIMATSYSVYTMPYLDCQANAETIDDEVHALAFRPEVHPWTIKLGVTKGVVILAGTRTC